MFQLNQKLWNDPKKSLARQETIVNQYQKHYNRCIPEYLQYWSMCGQCTDKEGNFLKNCELYQILKFNLVKPYQFHGVEINPEITKFNKKAFPQANWYTDDFYQALIKAKANDNFNPAIVNADFVNMPDRACGYFSDILAFLSVCANRVMVIGNIIIEYQRFKDRNKSIEYVINKLNKQSQFQFALKTAKWNFDQIYYRYSGTGKESRTTMGTIIFYK